MVGGKPNYCDFPAKCSGKMNWEKGKEKGKQEVFFRTNHTSGAYGTAFSQQPALQPSSPLRGTKVLPLQNMPFGILIFKLVIKQ